MEKFKHWQLFLVFFAPLFFPLHVENEFYMKILASISLSFVVIYLLAIGEYLQGLRGIKGHAFFRINCSYLVIIIILVNTAADSASEEVLIVASVFMLYALVAFVQVIDHVAILIRTNEQKAVDIYKQKPEFLLLFFWPVGIWFLQPRINKILVIE